MEFTSIIELNTYLSDNLTKLDIKQYIKKYHDVLHQDIDVSFMDYFLYLCEHTNEIIVKHEKLIEYGIFTSTRSSVIKERIDSIELVEGVDYLLQNVLQRGKSGAQTHIHYTFTPKAFKLCLMRSKKQIKYAKYYLFLEECIHYYQKYQELYTNVLLSSKDTKIDFLINQNEKIINLAEKQGIKLDEMNNTVKKLEIKIDELFTLVQKFLSGQIDLIYAFQSNIKDTKILIVYKLQNIDDNSKYNLVLRYSGLNQITSSISQFTKKKVNKNYKIVDFVTIGAIQQNMISVQQIYKKLDTIDSLNKQSINNLSNEECNELTKKIFDIVQENKINIFSKNIQSNEILKEHVDSMKHLTDLDNKFNTEIIKSFEVFLKEKLFLHKNFRLSSLCKELKRVYDKYH